MFPLCVCFWFYVCQLDDEFSVANTVIMCFISLFFAPCTVLLVDVIENEQNGFLLLPYLNTIKFAITD